MKRTIKFGKVDGYNNGRNNCEVTLVLELKETEKGPTFSCCGNMWNSRHTDILWGGQCIDSLYRDFEKLRRNPLFSEIKDLWKKYHLNDMKAGTPEQMRAINDWKEQGNRYDYDDACRYLDSIGMLTLHSNKPSGINADKWKYNEDTAEYTYKYGSAWMYEEIPEKDLELIKRIIQSTVEGEFVKSLDDVK